MPVLRCFSVTSGRRAHLHAKPRISWVGQAGILFCPPGSGVEGFLWHSLGLFRPGKHGWPPAGHQEGVWVFPGNLPSSTHMVMLFPLSMLGSAGPLPTVGRASTSSLRAQMHPASAPAFGPILSPWPPGSGPTGGSFSNHVLLVILIVAQNSVVFTLKFMTCSLI